MLITDKTQLDLISLMRAMQGSIVKVFAGHVSHCGESLLTLQFLILLSSS